MPARPLYATLALTLAAAVPAAAVAKSKKVLPWDLQMKADVLIVTKLPEYLGLGKICSRKDLDESLEARIVANYATLYSRSRDDVQKQVDDAARIAATYHGSECLTIADDARFKALYPDLKEMDGYLAEAVSRSGGSNR